ncbi:hypothetical protein FVEG_06730 [Fusarium verticillioides 7600]|uniref:Uncharacterized protein n=1 Tax=Gibberella moniliformis (strain M3125 / FGSC 7600) TaxID=334819 RepID=W7M3J5_GIBM7|nr:hypothetical protein FVEG_06730 [Fusarium verticillioides 7600]EWG46163.1 hypothetical protein FVEG_06730 [Fusarium verticillioides 7600]
MPLGLHMMTWDFLNWKYAHEDIRIPWQAGKYVHSQNRAIRVLCMWNVQVPSERTNRPAYIYRAMNPQQQMRSQKVQVVARNKPRHRLRHLILLYNISTEALSSAYSIQQQQQDQHPSIFILYTIAQYISARSRTQTMCRENYFQMNCETCDKELATDMTLDRCEAGYFFQNYELCPNGVQSLLEIIEVKCLTCKEEEDMMDTDELADILSTHI